MSEPSSRLPARPSLEQLQKQAKQLLRQVRAADPQAVERIGADRAPSASLADVQFTLAREYGFESWARLKQHVEDAIRSAGIEPFEQLARDVAAAYMSGDGERIREMNFTRAAAFVHYREPEKMHRRLPTWFASESRDESLALDDARRIVAHKFGFTSWDAFAASFTKPPGDPRSAPLGMTSSPPFYKIDWKANRMEVRGPQTDRHWDTIAGVLKEHRIAGLATGSMTDAGLDRVSRLPGITRLEIGDSTLLTDDGLAHLARMPQLRELDLSGWRGQITDRGLGPLAALRELRRFQMCWQQHVSDAGVAHLAACEHLEEVNLMGTPAGDGAIRALAGKQNLRRLNTGRAVTDAGLPLLHQIPPFAEWRGGEIRYGLMVGGAGPTQLTVDGPFTNAGLRTLAGLAGVFGLSFFWHSTEFTGDGLTALRDMPNLGFLGCEGERCTDEAMRQIGQLPNLRMLMGQGTVATDAGFAALSKSRTLEFIWGRECPNLTGTGFAALAGLPVLKGLAVSLKYVDDAALSLLPTFPALRQLMPMDATDHGFRHVGRCNLEKLWCMYCRETTDAATEHLAGLSNLMTYYAGSTLITDRSLEILGTLDSLERVELWQCVGVSDAGVARLARLPRLREAVFDGMPGVTREGAMVFPSKVSVTFSP